MTWEPSRLHHRLTHLRPTFPMVGVREEGGGREAGPREGMRGRNTKKKQTRRQRRTTRTILQTKETPCTCCARRHRRKAHRKGEKTHAPACETRNNSKRGRGGCARPYTQAYSKVLHSKVLHLEIQTARATKNTGKGRTYRENRTRKPSWKRTLNYHFVRNRALKVPQRKSKQRKEGEADRKVRPLSLSPTKGTR